MDKRFMKKQTFLDKLPRIVRRFCFYLFDFKKRLRAFLSLMRQIFKIILLAGKKVYTSQWTTNTVTKKRDNAVVFEVIPAQRDGKALEGAKLKREYIFENNLIKVRESLSLESPEIKKIKYNKILQAQNFKVISNLDCKENPTEIFWFINKKPLSVEISFELKDD